MVTLKLNLGISLNSPYILFCCIFDQINVNKKTINKKKQKKKRKMINVMIPKCLTGNELRINNEIIFSLF